MNYSGYKMNQAEFNAIRDLMETELNSLNLAISNAHKFQVSTQAELDSGTSSNVSSEQKRTLVSREENRYLGAQNTVNVLFEHIAEKFGLEYTPFDIPPYQENSSE